MSDGSQVGKLTDHEFGPGRMSVVYNMLLEDHRHTNKRAYYILL
ncbi:MAG: hypothetical protein ACRD8W_08665 [Nitrososphaeraceae archaeon]